MLHYLMIMLLLSIWAVASPTGMLTRCNVCNASPDLPANQTSLTVPCGETVINIALGVGVQNYTCSASGTYTSVGAVAELLDVSCLFGTAGFQLIQDVAFEIFSSNEAVTVDDVIKSFASNSSVVLGQHYFATNPMMGSSLVPIFDFRAASREGDPNAFVGLSKVGDVPDPMSPQENVDWLELVKSEGDLSKHVFRLNTRSGQPPASCAPGSPPISVKYAAKYWFFN